MAPSRKRRSDQRDPSPDNSSNESPPRRRRRSSSSSSPSAAASETSSHSAQTSNSTSTLAKKLVRLALSTEYARTPLRRTDISSKIFANQPHARNFKAIFALAQADLESKFGMQLHELPSREKVDLKSRRQHHASQAAGTSIKASSAANSSGSSKSWILISTLPAPYKTNPIITTPTSAGGSHAAEASYTALYTFVVSVIYLNNGVLAEAKLERYLKRVNAETYTSVGATEKVLARMVREGYVEKRRDTSSGEECVEWVVGPRGKVEVGIKGVTGLVKGVYGFPGVGLGEAEEEEGGEVDQEAEEEELDRKLKRSLGIKETGPRIVVDGGGGGGDGDAEAEAQARPEEPRRRGRPRRAPARDERSGDDA